MSERDLRQLRGLLRDALAHLGMPTRTLEGTLGIGHGNLSHLLEGRLELRVRHLLSIARELGVPPHQFLQIGCPETTSAARRDLGDLIPTARKPAAPQPADLDERIRAIVREELAARFGDKV